MLGGHWFSTLDDAGAGQSILSGAINYFDLLAI